MLSCENSLINTHSIRIFPPVRHSCYCRSPYQTFSVRLSEQPDINNNNINNNIIRLKVYKYSKIIYTYTYFGINKTVKLKYIIIKERKGWIVRTLEACSWALMSLTSLLKRSVSFSRRWMCCFVSVLPISISWSYYEKE